MNTRQAAKNLIDAAIRYQVYKLALPLAPLNFSVDDGDRVKLSQQQTLGEKHHGR